MWSRCIKFGKHLFWIMSSGMLVAVLASELALESTCLDDVVLLEPIAETKRFATQETNKTENNLLALAQTKDANNIDVVLFPNALSSATHPPQLKSTSPAEMTNDLHEESGDQLFEKTTSAESSSKSSAAQSGKAVQDAPSRSKRNDLAQTPENSEDRSDLFGPDKGVVKAKQTAPNISWDEIFNSMGGKENSVGSPAAPTAPAAAPKRKGERPGPSFLDKVKRPAPAPLPALPQVTEPFRKDAPKIPAPVKVDAEPVMIFPSRKVNPHASWDDIFDNMQRKENGGTLPAQEVMPERIEQKAGGPIRLVGGVLPPPSQPAAPTPTRGAAEILSPDDSNSTPMEQKKNIPSSGGQCEDYGPFCACTQTREPPVSKKGPQKIGLFQRWQQGMTKPVVEKVIASPASATQGSKSAVAQAKENKADAFTTLPLTSQNEDPWQPQPKKTAAILPSSLPSETKTVSALAPPSVPDEKAPLALPPPPPFIPASPGAIPPPPSFLKEEKTTSIPPPPATVAKSGTAKAPAPAASKEPAKEPAPAASSEKRIFSTAMPQSPLVAPIRNKAEATVFSSPKEKLDNFTDLRNMIAKKPAKADKPPAPGPAAPLIIAKLPDALPAAPPTASKNPTIQTAAGQGKDGPGTAGSIIPVSAVGVCPQCGRQNGALPPGDAGVVGRCEGCGRGGCVPGASPCSPCDSHTILGGFLCDLYQCFACPDPCYEGKWLPQANSAFFAAGPRPVSQMRLTYDGGRNLIYPDRSEYFWARADGKGRGPTPVAPHLGEGKVQYDELNVYLETAVAGVFSTFISVPYLSLDPQYASHAAGIGDLSFGTKTLLYDCELLLFSGQMLATVPTGNAYKGLGTGHVSLEPSLLFALKLTRDIYLQSQLAEWIPIGGDSAYQGSNFQSHFSYNQVLWRILPDVPIIGTMEAGTLTFQHGNYTDPVNGPFQRSSGYTYVTVGPGIRLFVSNRFDLGVGSAFAVTQQHFAQSLVRVQFRYRF